MKKHYLLLLFLFNCTLFCFGQNNNIDKPKTNKDSVTKLRIDGYYYSLNKYYSFELKDSVNYIHPIIFYKNGKVAQFDFIGNSSFTLKKKGKKWCTLKPKSDFKTIFNFIECILEKKKKIKLGQNSSFIINGKKIIIKVHGDHKLISESRGLVLNDSTFLINRTLIHHNKSFRKENRIYQFKKYEKPPLSRFKFY